MANDNRHFSITTDVDAAPECVWQVMSDPERWHEWTPSITRIRLFGGGPIAVGKRALGRQPKLPPAIWTVTAVEPGRSFTWESIAPGLRVVGRHEVEPTSTGSRATLSIEMLGMLGEMWGRLTRGITKRYLALEANGLKARSMDPGYRRPPA
jgi:uncharacterized protein YndB with AHSA1/START domain